MGLTGLVNPPIVKYAGAMKNIMMNGDLSTYINIDTLSKKDLYGLGPVTDLKGELLIWDGIVYSSKRVENRIVNQQNRISKAAMLVYSHVKSWKTIELNVDLKSIADLERLIEETAVETGYDLSMPFAFKIEAVPTSVDYHVINWEKGISHTKENHHQFAYNGQFKKTAVNMLGFYSRNHQGIFTHHTSFMHIHVMDMTTKTIGHMLDIKHSGEITIYLAIS